VATALRQRPELQAIDAQMRAQTQAGLAFAADARPLLRTIITAGGIDFQDKDADQPHSYAGGLMLTWPFYDGGLTRSEIAQSNHQLSALTAQRAVVAQGIREQVTQDRLQLQALVDSLPAAFEALRRAEDLIKLATERYQAGLGTLIEVQEAEAQLLSAATDLTNLQYDIATAQAALRYVLGYPLTYEALPPSTVTPLQRVPSAPNAVPGPRSRPAPSVSDLPDFNAELSADPFWCIPEPPRRDN
jgi:outer membrane protein